MQRSVGHASIPRPFVSPIHNSVNSPSQKSFQYPSLIRSVEQTRAPKQYKPPNTWIHEFTTVEDHNEQVQLLENLGWRQCTSMPVRKIHSFSQQKSPKNGVPNAFPKCYKIEAQKIDKTLQNLKDISLPQALYILSECLLGYQALHYKSKNTHSSSKIPLLITLKNCGFNHQGECRVGINLWNEDLKTSESRNKTSKSIIMEIFNMIGSTTWGNTRLELQMLMQKLERISQISYNLTQALIREFAQQRNIRMPKKIDFSRLSGKNSQIFHPMTNHNFPNDPNYTISRFSYQNINKPSFNERANNYNWPSTQKSSGSPFNWNPISERQEKVFGYSESNIRGFQCPSSISHFNSILNTSSIDQLIPQSINNGEYITASAYSLKNLEGGHYQVNTGLTGLKENEPKIKQFVIHEEQWEETPSKGLRESKKLTIIPQFSFISQFSHNSSEPNEIEGKNKSTKTTQCNDSSLGSTRFNQWNFMNSLNTKKIQNHQSNSTSYLKAESQLQKSQNMQLGQREKFKASESIILNKQAPPSEKSQTNYNFGGVLPQIQIKSKSIQRQELNRPISNYQVPNQHQFTSKITSSVYFGQSIATAEGTTPEWTSNLKLFTDHHGSDLKESVYCGEQEETSQNMTKLSKLGKLGRMIGKSFMPIPQNVEIQRSYIIE